MKTIISCCLILLFSINLNAQTSHDTRVKNEERLERVAKKIRSIQTKQYVWEVNKEIPHSIDTKHFDKEGYATKWAFESNWKTILGMWEFNTQHDISRKVIKTTLLPNEQNIERSMYEYTYDEQNNRTNKKIAYTDKMVERATDCDYQYDEQQRLTLRVCRFDEGLDSCITSYNSEGLTTKERYVLYQQNTLLMQMDYIYDKEGRLKMLKRKDQNGRERTVYNYDKKGNLIKARHVYDDIESSYMVYEYNKKNQKTKATYHLADESVFRTFEYRYNKRGDVIKMKQVDHAPKPNSLTTVEEYVYEYY